MWWCRKKKLTWRGFWSQESQRAALQLEQAVQLAEREADRLRVMLDEREGSHDQITAELEQQLRLWAQELGAECQHLHLMVEQSGAKQRPVQLPPRYNFLLFLILCRQHGVFDD